MRDQLINMRGRLRQISSAPAAKSAVAIAEAILDTVRQNGGFLAMTEKSPPEEIYDRFSVSKRTFKKALGALYKRRSVAF